MGNAALLHTLPTPEHTASHERDNGKPKNPLDPSVHVAVVLHGVARGVSDGVDAGVRLGVGAAVGDAEYC